MNVLSESPDHISRRFPELLWAGSPIIPGAVLLRCRILFPEIPRAYHEYIPAAGKNQESTKKCTMDEKRQCLISWKFGCNLVQKRISAEYGNKEE